MKKNYFEKFSEEEWHYFRHLQISLISDLIEGSWIPLSVSAFNLLQYVFLDDIYGKKIQSHRYSVGIWKSILIDSSDHFWIFISVTTILTSGSFLSVESEIILVNFFISCCIKIHFHLIFWMYLLPIVALGIGHFENYPSLD